MPPTNPQVPSPTLAAAPVCELDADDAVAEPDAGEADAVPVASVSLAFLALPVYGAADTPVPLMHWEGVAVPEVKVISAHYDKKDQRRSGGRKTSRKESIHYIDRQPDHRS